MIRKDLEDIDEETFLSIVLPVNDAIKKYVEDNDIIYDYVALYIATHYKMDAMWETSLEREVNSATESLCDYAISKLDLNKIKNILKDKHSLIVENENLLKFEDSIKKEPSPN